jgi:hypothetical protein
VYHLQRYGLAAVFGLQFPQQQYQWDVIPLVDIHIQGGDRLQTKVSGHQH